MEECFLDQALFLHIGENMGDRGRADIKSLRQLFLQAGFMAHQIGENFGLAGGKPKGSHSRADPVFLRMKGFIYQQVKRCFQKEPPFGFKISMLILR